MNAGELFSSRFVRICTVLLLSGLILPTLEVSALDDDESDSVFQMSLEELMSCQVMSVSKIPEDLRSVASAIYLITDDDIRRSGATHLLDVLNMVPGVWMQEISRNMVSFGLHSRIDEYPLSVRVLLDGVPIWSPVTGGPMFQYINIPVEQIERIEVIKGPGGTIYGANANAGIISIYTKKPEHSIGTTIKLNAGTQDYCSPFLRFGGKISANTYLSGFVSYLKTSGYDHTDAFDGDQVSARAPDGSTVLIQNSFPRGDVDGQESITAGGQLQTEVSDKVRSTTRLFVSSTMRDAYTLRKVSDEILVNEDNAVDLFVSECLDFSFSDNHSAFAHAYYRYQDVDVANDGGWNPKTSIFELELQDNLQKGINSLSFGANGSLVAFNHENGVDSDMTYFDLNGREQLYGAFVQDTIALNDNVDLTMGVKAETWTLADKDPEYSPSIRLAVNPDDELLIWGAISRSVTTPGYFHRTMEHRVADVYGDGSTYVAIVPGDSIKATRYLTYEIGLRTTKIPKTFADFSVFYSDYKDMIGLDSNFMTKDMLVSKVGNYNVLPMYFTNTGKGESYGGDAVFRMQPIDNVSFELSYSAFFFEIEGQEMPGQSGAKFSPPKAEFPYTPEHVIRLRNYFDFPSMGTSLMIGLIWASESYRGAQFDYLTQREGGADSVYPDEPNDLLKVNFNIEKSVNDAVSINLWGRNILADDYVEYYSQFVASGYPHTINRTFGCGVSFDL